MLANRENCLLQLCIGHLSADRNLPEIGNLLCETDRQVCQASSLGELKPKRQRRIREERRLRHVGPRCANLREARLELGIVEQGNLDGFVHGEAASQQLVDTGVRRARARRAGLFDAGALRDHLRGAVVVATRVRARASRDAPEQRHRGEPRMANWPPTRA